MGYIYKIYTDKSDHVYIGQTVYTPEIRWQGHQSAYEHFDENKAYDVSLYRAMKKYEINTFHIIPIEQCDDSLLNEREVYWIQYYDSYYNGYNDTLGGGGVQRYDHQAIIDDFKNTQNMSETARNFNCSVQTVLKILQTANIERRCNYEHWKVPVYQIDKKTLQIINKFDSVVEAANYIHGKTKTISGALQKHQKTAYGYIWCRCSEYVNNIAYQDNRIVSVICVELNTSFDSMTEASIWLKENNPQITGTISGMASNISRAIKRNIRAYGYHWKENFDFSEKS